MARTVLGFVENMLAPRPTWVQTPVTAAVKFDAAAPAVAAKFSTEVVASALVLMENILLHEFFGRKTRPGVEFGTWNSLQSYGTKS